MAEDPFAKRTILRFKEHQPVIYYGTGIGNQLEVIFIGWAGYSARAYAVDCYFQKVADLFDISITTDPQTQETLDGTQADTIHSARGDGHYFIIVEVYDAATGEIQEVSTIQCVIPTTVVEIDARDWELEKPIVYYNDQFVGARHCFQAPLSTVRIPSGERFASSVYNFKPKEQLGRVLICHYNRATGQVNIVDSGWVHRAIIEVTYEFRDLQSCALWVADKALKAGDVKDDLIDYVTNPNIRLENRIKALLPHAVRQMEVDFQARIIRYEFKLELSPPTLKLSVYHRFGFLNIDWNKVIGYALIGAAIAGAIAVTAVTFGIGAPVGASMVCGALAGAGVAFATSQPASTPPSSDEQRTVKEAVEETKETVNTTVDEALNVLKEEYEKGNVTPEAYERIKTSIENIRTEVTESLTELEDEAITAINRARTEGALIGGGIGLVGGGLVGWAIGTGRLQRGVKRIVQPARRV